MGIIFGCEKSTELHQVIFFGDSLTHFYNLKKYFKTPTINKGIVGNNIIQLINRAQKDVIDLCPTKIFLLIGTNDLGENKEIKDILSDYKKLVRLLTKSLPDTKLYIVSCLPVVDGGLMTGIRKTENIILINKELTKLCKQKEIEYIDIFSLLVDKKCNILNKKYSLDGLHINKSAYDKITRFMKHYIK